MSSIFLQDMVDDIRQDTLPLNWTTFDLADFSSSKRLWDYQRGAVENAIKVLWKYFKIFAEFQKGESLEANKERKLKFFQWYEDNGLEADLDISLKASEFQEATRIPHRWPFSG